MQKNNPSQMLMDEHDIIKKAEKIIQDADQLWEKDAPKYEEIVTKMLYFFKEYSDRFHHYKEENVLFPEMRNHPDFNLETIITELEEHHELFREYTADIRENLEGKNHAKAQQILKKYISDLLDHIAIEDDELFSMAENLFSDKEYETVYFKFKDIDLDLGEEFKRELERIPQELQAALQVTV